MLRVRASWQREGIISVIEGAFTRLLDVGFENTSRNAWLGVHSCTAVLQFASDTAILSVFCCCLGLGFRVRVYVQCLYFRESHSCAAVDRAWQQQTYHRINPTVG